MSNSGWEKYPNGIEMCRYEKRTGGYGTRLRAEGFEIDIPYDVHLALCGALKADKAHAAGYEAGQIAMRDAVVHNNSQKWEAGKEHRLIEVNDWTRALPIQPEPNSGNSAAE